MEKEQKIIRQKIVKVNGEQTYKDYVKVKILGKGGFASCYLTKNTQTNTLSATKIVAKTILINPRTKMKLQNEIKIHKMLHCEYVVKFYEAFEDKANVYVVMELCPNNSLNQYLAEKKKFSIAESQKFISQLAEGIKYLHDKKIIHRDFKLGNVFLGEDNKVKIGDFGLATKIEFLNEKKRTVCGTPNYLAPEIIKGVGYGYEVDIWSLGIMLFTFLVGTPPFETDDFKLTYERISRSEFGYGGISVPDAAKQLIFKLLNVNPSERPTIQEILDSDFLKYGKLTLKVQPSLSILNSIQNNQSIAITPYIISSSNTKQGFCYLLSSNLRGIITQHQSLLINDNDTFLVLRDKIDKIKKLSSPLDESSNNLKLFLQSVKFQRKQKKNQQKLVYVRKYSCNKNTNIYRMSNQTVHFEWNDGYYAIVNRNMRIWITDGKKLKMEVKGEEGNKIVRMRVQYIKQFFGQGR